MKSYGVLLELIISCEDEYDAYEGVKRLVEKIKLESVVKDCVLSEGPDELVEEDK